MHLWRARNERSEPDPVRQAWVEAIIFAPDIYSACDAAMELESVYSRGCDEDRVVPTLTREGTLLEPGQVRNVPNDPVVLLSWERDNDVRVLPVLARRPGSRSISIGEIASLLFLGDVVKRRRAAPTNDVGMELAQVTQDRRRPTEFVSQRAANNNELPLKAYR